MNDILTEQKETGKLQTLKKLAATVYLCQALTFMLAGLPLLVGVAINFFKRNEVQGIWLESHFADKSVCIVINNFSTSFRIANRL